jgi:hypothetical protein
MEEGYAFSGVLWEPPGEASWVFVTLDVEDSEDIRMRVPQRPGFGSVRVAVSIGETQWSTSIFPDSASGSYVLPIKRSVRDREGLEVGDGADLVIRLIDD